MTTSNIASSFTDHTATDLNANYSYLAPTASTAAAAKAASQASSASSNAYLYHDRKFDSL